MEWQYHIDPVDVSVKKKLESGTMTMRQARETLCKCGWFNYLPSEEQVMNLLNKIKL